MLSRQVACSHHRINFNTSLEVTIVHRIQSFKLNGNEEKTSQKCYIKRLACLLYSIYVQDNVHSIHVLKRTDVNS